MELKEMIKVMQHYEDGGEVEYSDHKDGCTVESVETDFDDWEIAKHPCWDWKTYNYRIKEPKQKVTIEKWLCRDNNGYDVLIFETSNVDKHRKLAKIKFIESYEIEL